ncbi:MAG: type II toxin-antitoxin system HigB family toxin [Hahellaceae bacterium]|nr:type II toxin-antitoxin system HigB family toxin [Hahellaceae bacterium]
MRLLGRERLNKLRGRSAQSDKWIRSWAAEVSAAHWKQPSDVQDQFPNAWHENDGPFMFPVSDCNCVICMLIAFPQGIALITDLKDEDESQ